MIQPPQPNYSSLINDLIRGGKGNDLVSGGEGDDIISGGGGTDTLQETADVNFKLTDTSLLGLGWDTITDIKIAILTGGDSNNEIDASGFSGPVTLVGLGGNDLLVGGASADLLIGGLGDDILIGGQGRDILLGGPGRNTLKQ